MMMKWECPIAWIGGRILLFLINMMNVLLLLFLYCRHREVQDIYPQKLCCQVGM